MVLYSPAGGVKYRMKQHARFGEHLAYVAEHGLGAVVELAREPAGTFSEDPRVGPWNSVLRTDATFAADVRRGSTRPATACGGRHGPAACSTATPCRAQSRRTC